MTFLEFFTSIDDRWPRRLAGMIDRTIDDCEVKYGASTIKNTIAPLVRVLDEAVRDGLITVHPAKHRAKQSLHRNGFRVHPAEDAAPRAHSRSLTCSG
ncbi:hypothetical protein [Lacisediminihabitans changchengi]|uniref:Uncharacterized protein n=1 Tax=Lacisediminihabitans changchengi TaxID=2787634 RepID=A0A934SLR6_9MICO|nr:hypothetical protein [Lacisediminihabitans changchengi]MBK4347694.1 hypothetical protein [Lacisediminihabitans changchengi]